MPTPVRSRTPSARQSASPPSHSSTAPSVTASPRVSSSAHASVVRRQSLNVTPQLKGGTRESLAAALKQETDKKEHLLLSVQDKDQTITLLTTENANLTSSLNAAKTRVNELYADHRRLEDEMATRIEVAEKLRQQVRDLEKEKRDVLRRYNEQISTFEAERQAFYDNEHHLKSRIQSLMQTRKQVEVPHPPEGESEDEQTEDPSQDSEDLVQKSITDTETDTDAEPAEMTSLRLELSTLSTSYSSLQSTLGLLQSQLVDLKRVNHELQEENESYMILLRERTLNGQFDVMRQVDGQDSSEGDATGDEDADESADVSSTRSHGRSTLDRVDETPEESSGPERDADDVETPITARPRRRGEAGRKLGASSSIDQTRGESLANLPITGPGLDLAAELGRAESKDVSFGNPVDGPDYLNASKSGRSKKDLKKSSTSEAGQVPEQPTDVEALRSEVKALKDANKALSLYASKIIDRIISQEGFEHVLAVDYDKQPSPPVAHNKGANKSPAKPPRERPASVMVGRSTSNPIPSLDNFKFGSSPQPPTPNTPASIVPPKPNRRSLSFDWKSFSMFNGGEKKPENPSLRPLKLKPGSTAVTGARKLETYEDEEDRRERERLAATMKLMGIHPPAPPASVPVQKPPSTPSITSSRFSLFRSRSTTDSDVSSPDNSSVSKGNQPYGLGVEAPSGLTVEALRQAEAEQSLAALDAHERALSAEMARGAGGGFTEITRRSMLGESRSRRSRISGESASTVWSAGMGKGEDEGEGL